jgi:hypothetical protein
VTGWCLVGDEFDIYTSRHHYFLDEEAVLFVFELYLALELVLLLDPGT